METTVKDRLTSFIKYKRMNKHSFEKACGLSTGFIANMRVSLQPSKVMNIANIFPDLNTGWLLTGEGEMLKSTGAIIGSNQGRNNKIEYNNAGSVGVGNTINVALPEAGTQKIINPGGGIEILTGDSSLKELDDLRKENFYLKDKISQLADNMQTKDDLIASLRDTIELLKHKQ